MAIGIDASRAFSERATGIGVYATEICRGLAQNPPSELHLYLNRRQPPREAVAAGVSWRCLPLARGWTRVRLAWEVRRHPPELLFIPAYRLPPGKLPRSVVTIHGVEHRFAASAYPETEARKIESFVEDTLRRADRIVSPSETTKADLVNLYGADPARIIVIPHGVTAGLAPLAATEAAPLLAELGVEGPFLLSVGAHHPRKNIGWLLRAFAVAFPAPGRGPRPRLVVTNATGRAEAELRQLGDQLALGSSLLLLPHVSGRRLAALYSSTLAACVPSLYEGFGLPALEAMACGAAVIANGVGGVQEVAQGAAMLVEPGDLEGWADALRRLTGDPALRAHLRQLGEVRSSRYSWASSVAEHARLLAAELAMARS